MTEWSLEAEGITNLCMPWIEIGNLGREEIQLVKIFLQMKRVWQIIDSTSWRLGQQCNNEFPEFLLQKISTMATMNVP